MNKFVVVDLETTGQTPSKGDRIIEIGIVVLENYQITTQYSTFIDPLIPIPGFITNLTGISDAHVAGAPTFDDVVDDVSEFFQDAYVVAHNVAFDLGFLNYEIQQVGYQPIKQPVIDTVELARILLPQAPSYKLGRLSEYLSFQHDDPHRALSDAYVTAELLSFLLQKLATLPFETLTTLQQLESRWKSNMYVILQAFIDEQAFVNEGRPDLDIFHGIALKATKKHDSAEDRLEKISFGDLLDDCYDQGGHFSSQIHNYEYRPSQREMSETIYDAFQSKQHALIEAETGTGKSLAYLIPAIYESVFSQNRVVISTHLTQLQSQLLEKEIPLLQRVLPFKFEAALLKGKQHYLSLKKFEIELGSIHQDNYDIILTKSIILVWLTETFTGDIDEIQLPSSGKNFFYRISSDAEGHIDVLSPWFSRSFYQKARQRAQKANLVITNHALLCTDLTSEHALLPSYQRAVIDEAHHLESTAAKHFGLKLDYVQVQFLLNNIGTINEGDWLRNVAKQYSIVKEYANESEWDRLWQETKEETDELFRYIFHYVVELNNKGIAVNDIGRYQYRFDQERENTQKWQTMKEMTTRLSFRLRDLIHILSLMNEGLRNNTTDLDADIVEQVQNWIDRLQQIIDDLELIFLVDDQAQVKWVEVEAYGAKNAVYLYSEPVNVSAILTEHFFEKKESVILTSATLTMKKSFTFIKERLGLGDYALEKQIASPFHYENQVQLLIPNDFPNLKDKSEDFIYATCEAIYSMATITDGRMLVLFTSYDMLKKSYAILKEIMDTDQFMLIAQGISSGSRERLKKNFQAFDQAILLGTSSFWEGVDIPGNDLSCLVIVRLPFQPPDHPIFESKSALLKQQGKNPFMELALPHAVIRFKQGFGRLIRSSSDRGIVLVCDDRIMKARYGKYFLDSIPTVPVTYKSTTKLLETAEDWL
ncbi:ATP-dependent DNA helicase DinG [Radiobacillus sp. PE A8.2]|uniref:ATP-dependent DNA helicase DinG n=1 Tax=Radiobacillus sp. PE A8.2 TaxID=3380349 RepID=UPI00389055DC